MAEAARFNPVRNNSTPETPQTWSRSITLFLSSIVNSFKYIFKNTVDGFKSGWRAGFGNFRRNNNRISQQETRATH